MSRQILKRIAVFTLALAVAASLLGCDEKPGQQGGNPGVRYMVVKEEPLSLTSELPGRVSAFMTSEVRPQVTGIIQERFFEEGADVKAGQVLYQIDPALFQAAYNSAAADLAKAEANRVSARLLFERYGKIIKSNAVSRQEHDDALSAHVQAQAAVEAAKQALESARINLGYTKVTAPVSGRISRSYVTPGALVTQNQPQVLATIQHMSTVYVDMTQSNTELLRLRRTLSQGDLQSNGVESAKVRLKLEDGTPYARSHPGVHQTGDPDWIEGDLLFSDVTIGKGTGAVNVRAKFDNPDQMLLPGMYVRAVVEEAALKNVVLVPQRAVMRDNDGQAYVYVLVKDGIAPEAAENDFKVARRVVEISRNIGNEWLISSGLVTGDKVLLDGHLKARPGRMVSGTAISRTSNSNGDILNAGRKGASSAR